MRKEHAEFLHGKTSLSEIEPVVVLTNKLVVVLTKIVISVFLPSCTVEMLKHKRHIRVGVDSLKTQRVSFRSAFTAVGHALRALP